MEEDIAEHRSKIHQLAEQKISGVLTQNDKTEGQQKQTLDIEVESATKREQHRGRKEKIRKEQKVLRILEKAEGKKDLERRKKQRKENVEQIFLNASNEVENGKRMKEMIITEPREEKLPTDHTVTSVLEVKDNRKENHKKNPLGQSLEKLPVERKSEEATGFMSGEDQRVRWWRKQGFY